MAQLLDFKMFLKECCMFSSFSIILFSFLFFFFTAMFIYKRAKSYFKPSKNKRRFVFTLTAAFMSESARRSDPDWRLCAGGGCGLWWTRLWLPPMVHGIICLLWRKLAVMRLGKERKEDVTGGSSQCWHSFSDLKVKWLLDQRQTNDKIENHCEWEGDKLTRTQVEPRLISSCGTSVLQTYECFIFPELVQKEKSVIWTAVIKGL